MGRINGWKRQQHYSNLEDAEGNLDADGRVRIGVWVHDHGGTIEHVYEPDAEEKFLVRASGDEPTFEEEGRYEYRYEGDRANKELMRELP